MINFKKIAMDSNPKRSTHRVTQWLLDHKSTANRASTGGLNDRFKLRHRRTLDNIPLQPRRPSEFTSMFRAIVGKSSSKPGQFVDYYNLLVASVVGDKSDADILELAQAPQLGLFANRSVTQPSGAPNKDVYGLDYKRLVEMIQLAVDESNPLGLDSDADRNKVLKYLARLMFEYTIYYTRSDTDTDTPNFRLLSDTLSAYKGDLYAHIKAQGLEDLEIIIRLKTLTLVPRKISFLTKSAPPTYTKGQTFYISEYGTLSKVERKGSGAFGAFCVMEKLPDRDAIDTDPQTIGAKRQNLIRPYDESKARTALGDMVMLCGNGIATAGVFTGLPKMNALRAFLRTYKTPYIEGGFATRFMMDILFGSKEDVEAFFNTIHSQCPSLSDALPPTHAFSTHLPTVRGHIDHPPAGSPILDNEILLALQGTSSDDELMYALQVYFLSAMFPNERLPQVQKECELLTRYGDASTYPHIVGGGFHGMYKGSKGNLKVLSSMPFYPKDAASFAHSCRVSNLSVIWDILSNQFEPIFSASIDDAHNMIQDVVRNLPDNHKDSSQKPYTMISETDMGFVAHVRTYAAEYCTAVQARSNIVSCEWGATQLDQLDKELNHLLSAQPPSSNAFRVASDLVARIKVQTQDLRQRLSSTTADLVPADVDAIFCSILKIIDDSLAQDILEFEGRDAFYTQLLVLLDMSPITIYSPQFKLLRFQAQIKQLRLLYLDEIREYERHALSIIYQAGKGVALMVDNGDIHCDIKLHNIVIRMVQETEMQALRKRSSFDEETVISVEAALVDLGTTSKRTDPKAAGGTPAYMCLDHTHSKPPVPYFDVYCLAGSLFEIMTGPLFSSVFGSGYRNQQFFSASDLRDIFAMDFSSSAFSFSDTHFPVHTTTPRDRVSNATLCSFVEQFVYVAQTNPESWQNLVYLVYMGSITTPEEFTSHLAFSSLHLEEFHDSPQRASQFRRSPSLRTVHSADPVKESDKERAFLIPPHSQDEPLST